MNREKVIRTNKYYDTETGYLDDESGEFISHSFDDEPALVWDERYWFINGEEYYDMDEIKEKFKNKILKLKNVNVTILKENNIDAIWLTWFDYIILDQSQYNLAILKFL